MKNLLAVMLLSVVLLFSSPASAMEIWKLDSLAIEDQGDYVALLLRGAGAALIEEGKADLAEKMRKLFTEVREGDKMTIGIIEFEENLARARVADAERHAKDHNAPRLEVEHAMLITLKKNGIVLPKTFMTVGNKFKPKHPPKEEKK